jgi:hypothetical protein
MSGAELLPIESVNAVELFTGEKLDELLDKIAAHARAQVMDAATDKGRKEIKSLARDVASSKVAIDNAGKELVADLKKQTGVIDAARKKARDTLDALRDEVRQPVTDWEIAQEKIAEEAREAERRRQEYVASMLRHIEDVGNGFIGGQPQAYGILFHELEKKINLDGFGAEKDQAIAAIARARAKLEHSQELQRREREIAAKEEAIRKAEEEARAKAESERLAREQAEREERIRKEAAERAEREAAEAKEQARLAEERAAREAEEAKERERLAAERAEREKKEAAERAEREKQEAVRLAEERARNEAAARERARLEDERLRAEEEKRRAADREHRAKINNEAMAAFTAEGVGETTAKRVITLIATGSIPNVSIRY